MTDQLNIRVYRTTFRDGRHVYEEKECDGRGAICCGSVRSIALHTRDTVRGMHDNGCLSVGIDFYPFHDIDCAAGLAPRICSPLTAEEQKEFWQHFCQE